MILEKIFLYNFRTYENLVLEPGPGLNVFHGPNGSGKTNLLEAIHVLSSGRSPRAFYDHEMARFGADGFHIKGLVTAPAGQATLEVYWGADRGKVIRVNGSPVPSLSALAGRFPVVYFSPDEIVAVSGPPARRRAFLDQLLCQAIPIYAHHLDRYRAALEQHNASLRDFRTGRTSDALLPVWEEQLAVHGGELLSRRCAVVADLNTLFREVFQRLHGSDAVDLAYSSPGEEPPPAACDAAAASAWLAAALAASRAAAIDRGYTLIGPHRDDLSVQIETLDARHFASQGQRRALTLALKLAAAEWIEGAAGARPVLLLDDVFSELDAERRGRLLSMVALRHQVFVTCTGPEAVQEITSAQGSFFSVRRGEILPVYV